MDSPGVDAVLVSCTGFRGLEAAETLAAANYPQPVISSNQAPFWKLAQLSGTANQLSFRYPDAVHRDC